MQPLDQGLQRRVWGRVYNSGPMILTKPQRQMIQRCLARCRENLRFYRQMQGHAIYAAAFERLARETEEHIKMMWQMLN